MTRYEYEFGFAKSEKDLPTGLISEMGLKGFRLAFIHRFSTPPSPGFSTERTDHVQLVFEKAAEDD